MTKKEKKQRAAVKKELQEKGILPPDKKPLNRKKFIDEAIEEWENRAPDCLVWDGYLQQAATCVTVLKENGTMRVSLEAVGAAKVLKLAVRLKEFSDMVSARGDTTFKIGEQYEYIKDILEA